MIYTVDLLDYSIFEKVNVLGKFRKRNARHYCDIICAFDIETTRLSDIEQSLMYIWQFQIGPDITVIGRTWDEYLLMLRRIKDRLPADSWLVIYDHNLSFEFMFMRGWYPFKAEEVFCTEDRKVLKCDMYECFEYRCSYYLTNMSLDRFLEKYQVDNKKLTYDYEKVRYPWTPLSQAELDYCINDVKGLVQAIGKMLKADDDNLLTVPLTSTGYVRRDVKEAMRGFNHTQMYQMQPTIDVYMLLREAFRGGDTLSNRWNTAEILKNIRSVDIVSSYPASLLLRRYPMSQFVREEVSLFDQIFEAGERAMLFRVTFVNIRIADQFDGHLYLSRDKCRDVFKPTYVNGRVLQAESLDTTLTDVDFRIVKKRYTWEKMYITELWTAKYRMLPSMFRDVIKKYYRVKTELKGIGPEDDRYYFYERNKMKLNSCYGLCVEDPAKDSIDYIDGSFIQRDEPLTDLLAKHNKHAFLSYAWGVWCTAWSRLRLSEGIDVVTDQGIDEMNFVYSDTDSIKYLEDADFSEFNREAEEEATEWGAYAADADGVIHYMGVFEDEGYKQPNRFKTLGAKKYVLDDGKLHITIAGVDKKLGAIELGKIENFKEGFTFRDAGGTEAVYNDNVRMKVKKDGHILEIRDNVVIRPSTYTLGITAEYRAILDGLVNIKYSDEDIAGLYKVKR